MEWIRIKEASFMLIANTETGEVREEHIVRVPANHEIAWIRLKDQEPEEVKRILDSMFHCHPLLVEDCIKLNQRPKLDKYKTNMFLTFFAMKPRDLTPLEMGIVIGSNYVVTIYKDDIPFLDEVYREMLEIEGRMDHAGEIVYNVLDRCVDEYGEIVDHIEDQVEKMERGLYRNPNIRIAKEVFRLKRKLHQLRRIFAEEKTIISALSHQDNPYIRQEADVYLFDVYDHISRVVDSVDVFRESLTALLELQMNLKSDRMNEIMKTLTVFSTLFLPLTFIAGVYGMNFHHMPELNWHYGYLYVWGVMAAVVIGMIVYFKRKKWW
jgi:magnesium transporter